MEQANGNHANGVQPNGKHHRRAHVLMVPADGHGHYYPFQQILYHLSGPRYVDKVTVTLVNSKKRIADVEKLKDNGDFGNLDLRLEVLPSFAPVHVPEEKPGPESFATAVQLLFESSLKEKFLLTKGTDNAPTCIMGDMFFSWLLDLAEKLNVPWIPLYPAPSWYAFSCLIRDNPIFLSRDPEVRKEAAPGLNFCRVFDYPQDIVEYPEFFATKNERLESSQTVLINVSEEWDAPTGALNAVRQFLESKCAASNRQAPKVRAIGPIVNLDGFNISPPAQYAEAEKSECITWLDKQPPNSVLYIAFGSVANLTLKAMEELAYGLEESGVSFLWVFKVPAGQTLQSILPPRFEDRMKGRAFIETGFAPQSRILLHPSLAGFMSHCGWNSIMESVCAGVPLVTWPLALDQPVNARFVVNVWKAGVGIKKPDQDYVSGVSREEVTEAINTLMVPEVAKEVRTNVQMLQSLAKAALEEGGSSYKALHSFLDEITTPV